MGEKSFTLIELIVVIAIIAILAAIISPNAFKAIEKAKISRVAADAKSIKSAAFAMYSDTGMWPGSNWGDETGDLLENADRGEGFVFAGDDPDMPDSWDGPYLEKWQRNPWGGWYWWDFNFLDQNEDGIGLEHVLWIDSGRESVGSRIPLSSREKIDENLDDGDLDSGMVQAWQGDHTNGNLGFILVQGN